QSCGVFFARGLDIEYALEPPVLVLNYGNVNAAQAVQPVDCLVETSAPGAETGFYFPLHLPGTHLQGQLFQVPRQHLAGGKSVHVQGIQQPAVEEGGQVFQGKRQAQGQQDVEVV